MRSLTIILLLALLVVGCDGDGNYVECETWKDCGVEFVCDTGTCEYLDTCEDQQSRVKWCVKHCDTVDAFALEYSSMNNGWYSFFCEVRKDPNTDHCKGEK